MLSTLPHPFTVLFLNMELAKARETRRNSPLSVLCVPVYMCFVLIYTIYNINSYILSSIIDLYPPRLTLIPFHLTNGHLYHGGRV